MYCVPVRAEPQQIPLPVKQKESTQNACSPDRGFSPGMGNAAEAETRAESGLYEDVVRGLSRPQKRIPSKYFYDERGSELFEKITRLDEYYLTRTEKEILHAHADEIARRLGPRAVIIEPGSGSSAKTRLLIDHCDKLYAYVPVDISRRFLLEQAENLKGEYPELRVEPVVADYTRSFELPVEPGSHRRRMIFFPGSTVGNFKPEEARTFLGSLAGLLNPGDAMVIGVDLVKERGILERAYNDSEGVTAEFNKNLLHRINRELKADFDPGAFAHKAFYNEAENRIEMHLESLREQTVRVNGCGFDFAEGETIHTENSYKYTPESFEKICEGLFRVEKVWTDPEELFSVQFLYKI